MLLFGALARYLLVENKRLDTVGHQTLWDQQIGSDCRVKTKAAGRKRLRFNAP